MPAIDEAPNTPRRDVILIADASAEGQAIASALRSQGFAVAFSPIERLEARVLAEAPRVLLVDIDEPGARDAIERLRELPFGHRVELVCFGNPSRAAEIGASSAAGRAFARPLDIHAILAQTAALAEPAPLDDDSIVEDRGPELPIRPGETIPPGMLEDGTGGFPSVFQSAFPGAPEVAEMGASIFPPDEGDGHSPPTLLPTHPMQLSPDLMGLLASAEQRVLSEMPVSASAHPPAVGVGYEEDVDLVLSDEFLAILEEPLDGEDETPGTGPGLAQSGAIDPGTGPNALLGITTSSLAALSISDANPSFSSGLRSGEPSYTPNPGFSMGQRSGGSSYTPNASASSALLGQTNLGATLRDEPSSAAFSMPAARPTPHVTGFRPGAPSETRNPIPPPVPWAQSSEPRRNAGSPSAPRVSEPRQSLVDGPATAWEPLRPSRMLVDDTKTPVHPVDVLPQGPATVAPRRAMARPELPVAEPTIDVAPPTVLPARLAARFAAPSVTTAPAAVHVEERSSAPNPGPMMGATPSRGLGAPPTSPSLLARNHGGDPPPSVRMAPPVPPPLAHTPSSSPHAEQASPSVRTSATVLGPGDAPRALARAIASRATGALAFHERGNTRRVLLQDGDVVTAASTIPEESLLSFLVARGDIERDAATRLVGKLPASGRHAGAALIAHGYLGQDALWPVLRAHAEWLIGQAISVDGCTLDLEIEPPPRLRAEPSVFGGATGAEVFVEVTRRITPPELAQNRLGGVFARMDTGPRNSLLSECALRIDEAELVGRAPGQTVGDIVDAAGPDAASLLWALVCLEVLGALVPSRPAVKERPREGDPLDEEAIRHRVRARLALVEDGDYFALLGLNRTATSYEVRRAYLELRRTFEPSRLLTAATADLLSDVKLVLEVLDEAYEILKDQNRRDRYRRAIEAGPPS